MPFDVRVNAHIARSPDDVAAYMFDPRHDTEWITGIEHVDPLMRLAQPLVSRQIGRSLEADLRRLCGRLEPRDGSNRTSHQPGDQR